METLPPNHKKYSIELPDGSVRASLRYQVSKDEQNTTILEIPDCPTVLRLTLLFVEPKDKSAPANLAHYVEKQARKKNIPSEEFSDGKIAFSYDEHSQQAGENLLIRYWQFGIGNCIGVFSATMLADHPPDPLTKAMLGDIAGMVESFELARRTEFLETDSGTIQTTVTSIPENKAPKQALRIFNSAERETLAQYVAIAARLRAHYDAPRRTLVTLKELDFIFAAWLDDNSKTKPSNDEIACGLGAAFGEILVADLKMHWQILTDEYGTAWAMNLPGTTITAFPIESVRKRIEDRARGFFTNVYGVIKSHATNPEYK